MARRSDPRWGHVKGQPVDYINGHQRRGKPMSSGPDYAIDETTGCWVWLKATFANGYGNAYRGGRDVRAHRWFYEEHVGPIPDGHHVHHRCENKLCVNPDHLEALPPAEHHRGHKGRLTEAQVAAIRAVPRAWGVIRRLAREYGVSESLIGHIRHNRTWQGVV